jgi:hypothetical protein
LEERGGGVDFFRLACWTFARCSVPSRLIGELVKARLTMEQVGAWYGQKKAAEMTRLRGRQKNAWTNGTSSTG